MYAVLSSGGKQYRVEPGMTLLVERIAGEQGASVTFDRVLLVADGDDVTVGTPTVEGATITGTILREELGPKIVVFKYKQKVKYRRRTGHRQHLVRIRIDEIRANGSSARAQVGESEEAEAAPKARRGTGVEKGKADRSEESEAPAAAEPETPKAGKARAGKAESASSDAESASAADAGEKTKGRARAAKRKGPADGPKAGRAKGGDAKAGRAKPEKE